ncbi:MAG: 1-acyl-sn-glycerol-3-phosphate acyltransferase [Clostridia bacterium]|nr:1-acyl-sn-glycerol-3-phosphate acyltransferase [Clostridia bacterium]
MKIKTVKRSYGEVRQIPRCAHRKPKKPWFLLSSLIRLLSVPDLIATKFRYTVEGKLPKEPCLILMNHSSFLDLKIASKIFYPRRHCVVSTADGMVGKRWLMERIGCIPTQKYVTDLILVKDIKYALTEKKVDVLMYPEAGYSFDGRASALPDSLGGLVKLLGVPVVTVITEGAFFRQPLYNGLRTRKVPVRATVKCLLDCEEIKQRTADEINGMLKQEFTFDGFAWQRENRIPIADKERAVGLERIHYKCAACGSEGQMHGEGAVLQCCACKKQYEMDEYGVLHATVGETEFSHIPDWYEWEREQVREELLTGSYRWDTEVEIGMLVDHRALYMVGEGRLLQDENGFVLDGCDGTLHYEQKPLASYSLNADYYWYEIGDVVGIGNRDALYYCFPKTGSVTKARFATEELYKLRAASRRPKQKDSE